MNCISISYKTTPIRIREHFSFSAEQRYEFGNIVLSNKEISGLVIVSTCNRSEIYFSGDKSTITTVENELAKYKKIDKNRIKKYFRIYQDSSAIRHLLKVTSGLDSMVLGEDEILRQVKEAYQLCLENHFTNSELNIVFQGALSHAKIIKTDTKLSSTPVSIGSLAANKIIEYIKINQANTILIVGVTGKIGSIVAKNLYSKCKINIIGTSRTQKIMKKIKKKIKTKLKKKIRKKIQYKLSIIKIDMII